MEPAALRPVPAYDDRIAVLFNMRLLAENNKPGSAAELAELVQSEDGLNVIKSMPNDFDVVLVACNSVQKCEILTTAGAKSNHFIAPLALREARKRDIPDLIRYWERAVNTKPETD